MGKLITFVQIAALSLAGTVAAQTAAEKQTTPREEEQTNTERAPVRSGEEAHGKTSPHPLPSTSRAEGTAADSTPPGETETRGEAGMGTGVNPAPSTSPAEGTAADATPPGETPTNVFQESKQQGQESDESPTRSAQRDEQERTQDRPKAKPHPAPSTSRTEGTAADRTPPGGTPTRGQPGVGTGVNPAPSTSPAEGTAADSTPPGETPTGVFREGEEETETAEDEKSTEEEPQPR